MAFSSLPTSQKEEPLVTVQSLCLATCEIQLKRDTLAVTVLKVDGEKLRFAEKEKNAVESKTNRKAEAGSLKEALTF